MEQPEKDEEFSIRAITKDDEENVLEMLRKSFFRDEPMNSSLGLADDPESCRSLEQYCRKYFAERLSRVVITKSGNIAGVCLNSSIVKNSRVESTASEEVNQSSIPFVKIINLLHQIERKCDIFQKYSHAEKILDLGILSVDDSYRGKGISKLLINETRQMAIKLNYPLIQVVCSSHFSAKGAARLGFRQIFAMPYVEYVDADNQQLISPAHPHTEATVQVLELNERS